MGRQPRRSVRAAALRIALGIVAMIALAPSRGAEGQDAGPSASFRLVHPERQAAAMLRLFEGSRAAHPAAALAAWKRATREPDRLGKPTEAVISFFNPEMIAEWKILDGAEYHLGYHTEENSRRWRLDVPGDDGTFAALITALRLTGGAQEAPPAEGKPTVERLGRPGAAVGRRGGPGRGITLASSSAELEQAVERPANLLALATALESGLVFRVDPGRLSSSRLANVGLRRAVELARGLGCRSALGSLGLAGDRLAIEVSTELDPGPMVSRPGRDAAIDPGWLGWIPADEAAACACLALGRGLFFWDGLFDVADRVDRADPARADLAPLRTRLNLLATAAGVRLEADFWPHLRGATFALLVDPEDSGRVGRALIALHLDDQSAARRLADEIAPGLAGLARGLKKVAKPTPGTPGPAGVPIDASAPRPLGRVGGRPLVVAVRDRTVLIGWGEGVLGAALRAGGRHEASVTTLLGESCTGPESEPPARMAAFWPGRMALPIKGLEGPTPLARALAHGPPIMWVGWNHGDRAADRISWPGLSGSIRRFLEAIPLDAASDTRR
jgi:hypothetical protein